MAGLTTMATGLLVMTMVATGASADGEDPQGALELHPRVEIETTLGKFVLELDAEQAPLTVMNFVQYVEDGFYNSTIFHRLLPGALIQGGAYTATMEKRTEGLRGGIEDESGNSLRNIRGMVALYRVPDRLESGAAQFLINLGDNTNLDLKRRDGAAYTVFGRVVLGMDTVDKIAQTPVGPHLKLAAGLSPVVPLKPVVIKSVRLLTPFSPGKAQAVVEARELRARQAEEDARKATEAVLRAKLEEFEAKARQAGTELKKTESGLMYVDLVQGRGAPPIPEETVSLHYRGTLLDGTELVNTYTMDSPATKQVSKFIEGVEEGLTTMYEGGKRILLIPPELAFGDKGVPGRVPPNATLIFEIELLSIE